MAAKKRAGLASLGPPLRFFLAVLLGCAGIAWWLSTTYGGAEEIWRAPSGSVNWVAENDDGPVTVRIGTSRDAGYRIGDIIEVQVVVVADRGVHVDLSGLQKGVFVTYGESDFELAGSHVSHFEQHGKDVWVIALDVRSWKVDETIDFYVEVPYATRDKDGSLSWTSATSPTTTVQTTRSAQKDDQFDTGNRGLVTGHGGNIGMTLAFLGFWLALSFGVWKLLLLFPRIRKLIEPSPSARAWKVFDEVFADARKHGWTVDHYMRIAGHLRRYLGLQPLVLEDLSVALASHPHADVAVRVFTQLESALYAGRNLSGKEHGRLQTDLETLVPRK